MAKKVPSYFPPFGHIISKSNHVIFFNPRIRSGRSQEQPQDGILFKKPGKAIWALEFYYGPKTHVKRVWQEPSNSGQKNSGRSGGDPRWGVEDGGNTLRLSLPSQ